MSDAFFSLLGQMEKPEASTAAPSAATPPIKGSVSFSSASMSDSTSALLQEPSLGAPSSAKRRVHYSKALGPGPTHVYNVDTENDLKANLLVNAVTRAKYQLTGNPPLAVDSDNLCYVVRTGDLRVLSNAGGKGVIKGFHEGNLTDACFADVSSRLLATASDDQRVCVQRLVARPSPDGEPRIEAEPFLLARLAGSPAATAAAPVRLSWHPRAGNRVLAAAAGSYLVLLTVPETSTRAAVSDLAPFKAEAVTKDPSLLPSAQSVEVEEGRIISVAFSSTGESVAVVTDSGSVAVWAVTLTVNGAAFLHQAAAFRPNHPAVWAGWVACDSPLSSVPRELLLTLSEGGQSLELQTWDLREMEDGRTPRFAGETLIFSGAEGCGRLSALSCPEAELLLIHAAGRKTLFGVKYRREDAAPFVVFESVTQFPIAAGIHSLALFPTVGLADEEDAEGGEGRTLTLLGLMPTGLHKFDLDLAMVQPPPPHTIVLESPPSDEGLEDVGASPTAPTPSEPVASTQDLLTPPPLPDLYNLLVLGSASNSQKVLPVASRENSTLSLPEAATPAVEVSSLRQPSFANPEEDDDEPLDVGSALLQALQKGPLGVDAVPSAPPMPASFTPKAEERAPRVATVVRTSAPAAGSAAAAAAAAAMATVEPPMPVKILKRGEVVPTASAPASVPSFLSTPEPAAGPAASPAPAPSGKKPQQIQQQQQQQQQAAAEPLSPQEPLGKGAEVLKRRLEIQSVEIKALTEAVKSLKKQMEDGTKLKEKKEEQKKTAQVQAALVAQELKATLQLTVKQEVQRAVQEALPKALGAALHDALRTQVQSKLVPAFEAASRTMLEQLQSAVIRGLEEYVQPNNAHLAGSLQKSLESAAQVAASLRHVSDGWAKTDGAHGARGVPAQHMGGPGGAPGPMPHPGAQGPSDLTAELRGLLHTRQFSAAFEKALNTRNYHMVTWLCREAAETGMNEIFGSTCQLSQICLLVLVQQLGWDLSTELRMKVEWMQNAAVFLNPRDPAIAGYVRQTIDTVLANLRAAIASPAGQLHAKEIRLLTFTLEKSLA